MKVYIPMQNYQDALKMRFGNNITFVKSKKSAELIISGRVTKDDIGPTLKGVIIPYTGTDGIDLAALNAHQLPLFNTHAHAKVVAEKAVQLMHAVLGNTVPYHNRLARGEWSHRNEETRIKWISAYDQAIGIYGYGHIGKAIHQLLKPFHGTVHVIDRGKTYDNVVLVKDLETLVKKSSIIFIAAPLNKSTEGAFSKALLMSMQGKVLINVGRGTIIDEHGLYLALKQGVLTGFGSDVWFRYPKKQETLTPSQYPLEMFPHVVMSPHCASFTDYSRKAMLEDVLDLVAQIMAGDLSRALNRDALK